MMQACVFHRERSQQEPWSHLGAMPIGAVLLFSVAESPREQDFRSPQLLSLRIQQCLELLSFLAHLSRVPARTQAANESQPVFRASLNYTHLGNGQNFCPLDLFSWSQQNIAQSSSRTCLLPDNGFLRTSSGQVPPWQGDDWFSP